MHLVFPKFKFVYVCSRNVLSLLFLAYCGSPIHNSLTLPVLDFHQKYRSKVISVLWGSGRMSREQVLRNFEKSEIFIFTSIFAHFSLLRLFSDLVPLGSNHLVLGSRTSPGLASKLLLRLLDVNYNQYCV